MTITASWIWTQEQDYKRHNQTIIAQKHFSVRGLRRAHMLITADSYYRLTVNGVHVNDGPCRSWPEHYQYDLIDVRRWLVEDENEVAIVARYFGVGTFHQAPAHPGLLVQLELTDERGEWHIESDESWEVCRAAQWLSNTPKISIQMEPFESYDARLEGTEPFEPATVVFAAHAGPWKNLNPRDCPLLTKVPIAPVQCRGARTVVRSHDVYCFPVARLLYPGLVEANNRLSLAYVLATSVVVRNACSISVEGVSLSVTVNGKPSSAGASEGSFSLHAGANLLLAVPISVFGHRKEALLAIDTSGPAHQLQNPIDPADGNPWCFYALDELLYAGDDMVYPWHPLQCADSLIEKAEKYFSELSANVHDADSLQAHIGVHRQILSDDLVMEDPHQEFVLQREKSTAEVALASPQAALNDSPEVTTVPAVASADVELTFDLGRQVCGYFSMELYAPADTIVDLFAVEYIDVGCRTTGAQLIQHTGDNANGLRYVCKEGYNRFVSLKRRSGRYLFLTLRNHQRPVHIRRVQVIESTYPVETIGSFCSSDRTLDRIWQISALTLKLCMEDTFTDCPLYEQTLWVGDARNEALFAMGVYNAEDLVRRCLRLAAQSLERYPLVGCQVPSSWDCLLPAWSFLWGIGVWEYFFYSGDQAFLEEMWPSVKLNIEHAHDRADDRDLFSAPFWNMFDWSGIDDQVQTVLHNSMLLVAALQAARKCARVLDDEHAARHFAEYQSDLVDAIENTWRADRNAYPDSIHDDGVPSDSVSVHTSVLAALYDISSGNRYQQCIQNMINPPENFVRIGSPFAMMFFYEALDKEGMYEGVIRSIYESYAPMVRDGATTVWETFPTSTVRVGSFSTRSHCHAWSSAPVYFLNRIVLGVRQTEIGAAGYDISPVPAGLTFARGCVASHQGPISVAWEIVGRQLRITATAPPGVALAYAPNQSHSSYAVYFNGSKLDQAAR